MSTYNGDDIYYQKDIIDIALNVVGEEEFIRMLKTDESLNKNVFHHIADNWNKPNGMKNKLKKMQKTIEKTKIAYDILDDKTLKNRNFNINKKNGKEISNLENNKMLNFQSFCSKAKDIPKIKTELSALFVFILMNSEFNNKTISPQHMKILESGGKVGKLEDEFNEE